MPKSKLSTEEIQSIEKAKDDRRRNRKNGFSLMHDRDASYARLRNYNGGEVIMQWHIPERNKAEGVAYARIPEGMFTLKIGKELVVFNAEEFRKVLRWA